MKGSYWTTAFAVFCLLALGQIASADEAALKKDFDALIENEQKRHEDYLRNRLTPEGQKRIVPLYDGGQVTAEERHMIWNFYQKFSYWAGKPSGGHPYIRLVVDTNSYFKAKFALDVNYVTYLKLDPKVPLVPADPEGIHRALLNIVGNALDAVEERPQATAQP